jgi:hypothetical protein
MNHGWIERIAYQAGGGRYGNRAYIRLWVMDKGRCQVCWVDAEATNYVLKKCDRGCWIKGRVYCEQSLGRPLVNLEQLACGRAEEL